MSPLPGGRIKPAAESILDGRPAKVFKYMFKIGEVKLIAKLRAAQANGLTYCASIVARRDGGFTWRELEEDFERLTIGTRLEEPPRQ